MSAPKLATRITPGGAEVRFDMRVFRRFECSNGATVQRWMTGSTGARDAARARLDAAALKYGRDFIFTREL